MLRVRYQQFVAVKLACEAKRDRCGELDKKQVALSVVQLKLRLLLELQARHVLQVLQVLQARQVLQVRDLLIPKLWPARCAL